MSTSPTLITRPTVAIPAVVTVGLGAAGWIITVSRMHGMDMGTATMLGSLPFFLSVWVPMMAPMMLPALAPSATGRSTAGLARFVVSYLAVWTLVGLAAFALYRPHSPTVAGIIVATAGLYELTPIKRRFREMARAHRSSGVGVGVCCVASTAGLMLVMLALGPMNLIWMALVAAVVLIQKLVPPAVWIDLPVAIAILGVAGVELIR